jgi:tRNA A37 threonylcarbamoyladenosine dehydratase
VKGSYEERFGGVGRLYGRAGMERLRCAHVAVVGVGGVGSWCVESLARTGVGTLTLIDLDDVCITNINRQLHAVDGQIGRPKVVVLAERVALINPECVVHAVPEYFVESTASRLLETAYDFVIDAIDQVPAKCQLLSGCKSRGLRVLAVGGAGGKRDATGVRIADFSRATQDPLLKQVRRRLRQEHGFPAEGEYGIPTVYSVEKPVYPWSDGTACAVREEGGGLRLDCSAGFGSAVSVTGVFGLAAAGEVIRRLALAEV